MTAGPAAARLAQQTQALLDLIEDDRARQCGAARAEAEQRAAAVVKQAQADARARMRQAFGELRARRRTGLDAAQARLATQRRLHEQQRVAALLRLAWQQLPSELSALWRQDEGRQAWVAHTLAEARARLPQRAAAPWLIVHAPDWAEAERQALAASLPPLQWRADASIEAGLKIVAQGNVVDGTLGALLGDRAEFEARLLRKMETST